MQGLMQDTPLQVSAILRFAEAAHPSVKIVSRQPDGAVWRGDYAALAVRCGRLARALARLGVQAGDRVATLAWNTHRHMELLYAVPGMGAVLHTANPRLSDDQLAYVLNHGGARLLFLDRSFLPLVMRLRPRLEMITAFVVLSVGAGECGIEGALAYEALLSAAAETGFEWPGFDERQAAVLCYTSGTTGDPKGVLYSHRSIVLHAMASGLPGALNLSAFDVVMPCSSLYHATGWGLPYSAPINGCGVVLPCDRMDAASLHDLIVGEGVTFAAGVPTIWTQYLRYLDDGGLSAGRLRRMLIGGSAVPRAMFEAFRARNISVLQLWGMTETSPLGVAATPTPSLAAAAGDDVEAILWTKQGRRVFGLDLRVVDDAGGAVPADGVTQGALQVRGSWVVRRYFRAAADAVDAAGWFDTGDIATIDAAGFIRLTDRAKDVIKSGGEWVSSIDLENEACACPGVRIAAAVGVPHPRWDERPVLVVERHEDADLDEAAVTAFLAGRVVKWWLPDRVVFDSVPLTATGKIDKKVLRARYGGIFAVK
jgi:fatty-acyl-CoA synthase